MAFRLFILLLALIGTQRHQAAGQSPTTAATENDPSTVAGDFKIPLKIGFMGPSAETYFLTHSTIETHGPAISLAIEDAQRAGIATDFNISVVWRNDNCRPNPGMSAAIELKWDENVDVVMGSFCSSVLEAVGHYWSAWNIPVFTHGGSDFSLSDKNTYNTLVRGGALFEVHAAAFVEIFQKFGWSRVVMLVRDSGACTAGAEAVKQAFHENDLTVAEWIPIVDERAVTDEQIDGYLDNLKKRARVAILCMSRTLVKKILLRAWRNGMTRNGDFVFFTYAVLPTVNTFLPWGDTSEDDFEEVKMAYRSLKKLTVPELAGPEVDNFTQAMLDRLAFPPWDSLTPVGPGSTFALPLYDTVYLYLTLVDETQAEGGDYKDGRLMATKARGRSFMGKFGHVVLDDKADRVWNFSLWHLAPDEERLTLWTDVHMTNPVGQRMDDVITSYWYTTDNDIPADCGTENNPCESSPCDPNRGQSKHASTMAAGLPCLLLLFWLIDISE